MKQAYWKDIWRTISIGKKRFISIAIIAALGVTMMCGLRASCEDLRHSADQFFDRQALFDIRILSTLGITDEDVKTLEEMEGVSLAEGGYNETVYTMVDGVKKSIDVRTLSKSGMNMPYLLDGEMPEKTDEIVITKTYKNETGKGIGDEILFSDEPEKLEARKYTITGIIIDVMDINSTEGSMGFRSTATTDYVGYVLPEAADSEVFTVLYLRMDGLEELNCYSNEYTAKVDGYVNAIEAKIKSGREKARYDEVYGEAMEEWRDGEREMQEEFAKADQEIADAQREIKEAKQKLSDARTEIAEGTQALIDGEKELNEKEKKAETEFANARAEIRNGYAQIASGKEKLETGYAEILRGQEALNVAKAELDAQERAAREEFEEAWQRLREEETRLDAGYEAYEAGKNQLEIDKNGILSRKAEIEHALLNPEISEEERNLLNQQLEQLNRAEEEILVEEQELQAVYEALEAGRQQLEAGKSVLQNQEAEAEQQFEQARQAMNESQAQLDVGIQQYQEGLKTLQTSKQQLIAGEEELNRQEKSAEEQIAAGRKEIASGWAELKEGEQEIADGEKELADGERELADNLKEYEEERAKAEKELADALKEIHDIDMTKWYVQDRTALSGYSNVKADADSIQAIGDIFPVLFLTVAILISLTTITRMVEEERSLIGTYKAQGFTDEEIRKKYLLYAALACLIGGVIGDIGGYLILPEIIIVIFHVMYTIPEYSLRFDALYGFGGILFFEAGILVATIYSCKKALKQMPATLMRPKTPKSGSRVFLERITFVWKRLSFLNKVTARNLFRYKKRLFMTIFGIAGCTGLLLCGFTIKDTVAEMMPQQYEKIYQYDLMVVSSGEDYEEVKETLERDEEIFDYLPVGIESVELLNADGESLTTQMIVVPKGESLEQYILLRNVNEEKVKLEDGDVLITRNASRVLPLQKGTRATIQTLDLEEAEVEVTEVVDNYFGNVIYLTEDTYTKLFGEFELNGLLAHFSETCTDQKAYTDKLAREESILSATSTQSMIDEFDSAFALLNMVVYVILVLAALLAFVVLFTLSNTNISERERELATIKVLGFYHSEVHLYVNKETWILTLMGILAGMPTGWLLGRYVMGILKLPSLEFYIVLYPRSFVFAAAITLIFAFVVSAITNKTLDKINMVEALKSVE